MEHWKELIRIDHHADMPVYLQIANAFIHNIRSGRLRKGLKLAGSRVVADALQINRMTMVAAYDELHAQGWIEVIPRKGTFIKKELPVLKPQMITAAPSVFSLPETAVFPIDTKKLVHYPVSDFPDTRKLELDDGFPDTRLAPTELLIRNMRNAARLKPLRRYLTYGGPQGTPLLRNILADFLSDTRGIPVMPGNMLITRGAQMGIYLAAGILLKPGDHLVVGEPGYFSANLTFTQLGATINRVPVDADGMDIDAVEKLCRRKKIRLVYVIPHHHHPTTVTLTPERRIKLLELSVKYRFAIIEDDYDYDFHYASKPMMPMASLDMRGSVIYIGTLTKTLAPAFRIGFVCGPANFIEAAANYRRFVDFQGDSLLENAVAALYKDGTIARHIKKTVKLYKERRDHFCGLLQQELGEQVQFKIPDGGMSVWTTFKHAALPEIAAVALKKGLVVNPGKIYNTHNRDYNAARLGFASLDNREQQQAIALLKASVQECSRR